VTTPENDETPAATPVAPVTTPENDETPVAPPAPPITPVQETPEAPEDPAPIPETGLPVGMVRFTELTGLTLYDRDAEVVGQLNSFLMDEQGRIAYAVVRTDVDFQDDGQFLAVPWNAIDVMSRQQVTQQFGNDFDNNNDLDNNNDQDDAATPAQPGQQPGQQAGQEGLTMTRTQWDRQFALVLNVERQALQDAPAFDYALTRHWDTADQWQDDLAGYWEDQTDVIPVTGPEGEALDMFQVMALRGLPVEDQDGERIGRVFDAVMRQPGDRIGFLIVETGGAFGFDTERLAVPMQHLEVQETNGQVVLVLTADRQLFDDAPRLQTEADIMNLQQPGTEQEMRQHWGTDPEWDDNDYDNDNDYDDDNG
jgi:sporulation protein YlmC with PRC-barrel domain